MLISLETPEADKYVIYDSSDNMIPFVVSFDTESEEIELFVPVQAQKFITASKVDADGGVTHEPISIKFKLSGAYATKDGQLI